MSPPPSFVLREALLNPGEVPALNAGQLGGLVTQARIARLLPTLALELEASGALDELAWPVRRHLLSAVLVHEKQKRDLAFDCESIGAALAQEGERLVLLKGGAYLRADLPVGRGRLITDIDIIVPRPSIEAAERALNEHGWESAELDPYNESYYRRWSHETPALFNRRRGTTLDLHHNILPPTAGPNVDAALLFGELREVAPGIFIPSLRDMVIHSATHLFHEGEFHHGLRDLWDLDRMLRDFPAREEDFWARLVERARQLQLQESLFHGLVYARALFDTPVPAALAATAGSRAQRLRRPLMDFLFLRAFRPDHPDCRLPLTGVALNALYLRSHYLRMPLYLLLPHLVRKAWMRRKASRERKDETGMAGGGA